MRDLSEVECHGVNGAAIKDAVGLAPKNGNHLILSIATYLTIGIGLLVLAWLLSES